MPNRIRTIALAAAISAAAVSAFAAVKAAVPAFRFPLAEAARVDFEGVIRGEPATAGGVLFLATDRGYVYAVAAGAAPAVAWRFEAKAALVGSPAPGPGGLLAADASNRVYLLDAATGKPVWALALTSRISSSPAWGPAGRILLTIDDTILLALDARGLEAWRFAPGGALRGGAVAASGTIAIGSEDGRVSVLGPDGRLLRTVDIGGPLAAPLAAAGDRLFASRADGTLAALDPASDRVRWTFKMGATVAAPPVFSDGRIYVTASNGVVFCFNARRGDLVWWHSLPSRSVFPPWIGDGLVLAASRSRILAGFKPDNGEKAGTFEAPADLKCGPVRAGDRIIVALADSEGVRGSLVFLKSDPPKAPAPAKK